MRECHHGIIKLFLFRKLFKYFLSRGTFQNSFSFHIFIDIQRILSLVLVNAPALGLLMPDRNYRVEIFSCRTVHAEQQYFKLWFNDDAEYREYLDKAVKQSYWTPPFVPETDLPILTLATCSTYNGDDEPRLLVHGRLIPID